MARVSAFWLTVVLIVAIVGCVEPVPFQYDLTVSSTAGGSVTDPGEGPFEYESGTVVALVAQADEGYGFVNWTGNVGTADDADAASTTVTMRGDYSITANFEAKPGLTISSTAGGSVTIPGEGRFTYDCGTVVDLVARQDAGYRFAGWTGDVEGVGDISMTAISITMDGNRSITAGFVREYTPMVDAGIWHTVGLRWDGSVLAMGWNEYGQCDVGDWMDIMKVAAGEHHTLGVSSNGTVVAVGSNRYGQCNIGDWTDIVQIDAGKFHTVGLKSDGTAVATGWNDYGQCDVADWKDIVRLEAGFYHTIGLRSDGTVVAVGFNGDGRLRVDGWSDITQVAAGGHQSVGLKSDGTVLAVGRNKYGECSIGGWTDIVQIAGGCQVTVGLKSDGSVVAAGWNQFEQCNVDDWSDMVQVTAGMGHTVGLRSDWAVVAVGRDHYGQCDVGDWILG